MRRVPHRGAGHTLAISSSRLNGTGALPRPRRRGGLELFRRQRQPAGRHAQAPLLVLEGGTGPNSRSHARRTRICPNTGDPLMFASSTFDTWGQQKKTKKLKHKKREGGRLSRGGGWGGGTRGGRERRAQDFRSGGAVLSSLWQRDRGPDDFDRPHASGSLRSLAVARSEQLGRRCGSTESNAEKIPVLWARRIARTAPDFLAVVDFDESSPLRSSPHAPRCCPRPGASEQRAAPNTSVCRADAARSRLRGRLERAEGNEIFASTSPTTPMARVSSLRPPIRRMSAITDEFYALPAAAS